MNAQEIESAVLSALSQVAPEMEPSQVDPIVNLRDQLDIDSMDYLNFIIALHKQFQVEIPESDYAKLSTLRGCVEYLSTAIGSRSR